MQSNEKYDFSEDAATLYESYLSTVQVLLVDYEIITGKFLTQALNEVRSVLTHISRASRVSSSNPALAKDNMAKADRHIKRAILDCYKALCIAYFKEQRQFDADYSGVDLRLANNGMFLSKLQEHKDRAAAAYAKARHADCEGTELSDEEIFNLYEIAYRLHKELDDFRRESVKDVEFAKAATDKNRELNEQIHQFAQKNNELAEKNDRLGKRSLILTVFGIVVTLISFIEAIVIALI